MFAVYVQVLNKKPNSAPDCRKLVLVRHARRPVGCRPASRGGATRDARAVPGVRILQLSVCTLPLPDILNEILYPSCCKCLQNQLQSGGYAGKLR